MRVTTGLIAAIYGVNRSTPGDWAKHRDFPDPLTLDPRTWEEEDVESWVRDNWIPRKTLHPWASRNGLYEGLSEGGLQEGPSEGGSQEGLSGGGPGRGGLRKAPQRPLSGGVHPEHWDVGVFLNRAQIRKMLNLSHNRVIERRDFPVPASQVPRLWRSVDVLAWAQDHAHLKSLSMWVGASPHAVSEEDRRELLTSLEAAYELGIAARHMRTLRHKHAFPSEVVAGGWARADVLSWARHNAPLLLSLRDEG